MRQSRDSIGEDKVCWKLITPRWSRYDYFIVKHRSCVDVYWCKYNYNSEKKLFAIS